MIVHCMESYGVSYGPVQIISRANYLKPLGARIIWNHRVHELFFMFFLLRSSNNSYVCEKLIRSWNNFE